MMIIKVTCLSQLHNAYGSIANVCVCNYSILTHELQQLNQKLEFMLHNLAI
jgi:hypothetical protein